MTIFKPGGIMYYLLRVIFVILTFSLIIFILAKSKIVIFYSKKKNPELRQRYQTDKRFRRLSVLTNLMFVAVFFSLVLIASFPLEGNFITLGTVEKALSYKIINTEDAVKFEYDDCVFTVDKNDNRIHSLTKKEGKYGLVDFNSDNVEYIQPDKYEYRTISPLAAKYNKDINKTFYIVSIKGANDASENTVELDGNKMTYTKDLKAMIFQDPKNRYGVYYCLLDGEPKERFILSTNDFDTYMYKTPYIRGISEKAYETESSSESLK